MITHELVQAERDWLYHYLTAERGENMTEAEWRKECVEVGAKNGLWPARMAMIFEGVDLIAKIAETIVPPEKDEAET